MLRFEILDYGVYANGQHIADFDDREYAKTFAKATLEANEAPCGARVVANYTGELVYDGERKLEVSEVIEEYDSDEEGEAE